MEIVKQAHDRILIDVLKLVLFPRLMESKYTFVDIYGKL